MKPYRRSLIDLVRRLDRPDLTGAEIGVWRGDLSATLLRAFPGLFLYLVDSWAVYPPGHPYRQSGDKGAQHDAATQAKFQAAAAAAVAFATDRYRILAQDSLTAAALIPDAGLDFVFIDGDHSYPGCRADLHAWWPKVKPGGLFSGHDCGHSRDRRGKFGVGKALAEFCAARGLAFRQAPGTVWYLYKPAAEGG